MAYAHHGRVLFSLGVYMTAHYVERGSYSPAQEILCNLNRVRLSEVKSVTISGVLASAGLSQEDIDMLITGCARSLEPKLHNEIQSKMNRIRLMMRIYKGGRGAYN